MVIGTIFLLLGLILVITFTSYFIENVYGQIPTFANPINLSLNGSAFNEQIGVNSDSIFVAWTESGDEVIDIFLAKSIDDGKSFSSISKIYNSTSSISFFQMHVEGENIYLVWRESLNILLSKSLDNGDTFSDPIIVSNETSSPVDIEITSSDNKVYVVWDRGGIEKGIVFSRSNDTGNTFSTPINLSGSLIDAVDPQIVANDNDIYIVWEELGTLQDVFFIKSNDTGISFSPKVNLSNNTGGVSKPLVDSTGNNVYVVWEDTHVNVRDIIFRKSIDGGDNFSTPKNLSNTDVTSSFQSMEVLENNVYLTWRDRIGFGNDIIVSISNDNGTTFSDPVNMSKSGVAVISDISASANIVDVVWRESPSFPGDIYFSRSNDNGRTFSIKQNISNSTDDPQSQNIVTEGQNTYIVWGGDTGGLNDVFFLAGTLSTDEGGIININFFSSLDGSQEVSPVDTNATGVAKFSLNQTGDGLEFEILIENLDLDGTQTQNTSDDVIGAHIHKAPIGVNGEIVVGFISPDTVGTQNNPLTIDAEAGLISGTITSQSLTGSLNGQPLSSLLDEMIVENTYINIHTIANSGGEIRGQVHPCLPPTSGDWILSTSCEMISSSTANGNVIVQNNSTLTVKSDDTLTISLGNHLLVEKLSGVLVKPNGTLRIIV